MVDFFRVLQEPWALCDEAPQLSQLHTFEFDCAEAPLSHMPLISMQRLLRGCCATLRRLSLVQLRHSLTDMLSWFRPRLTRGREETESAFPQLRDFEWVPSEVSAAVDAEKVDLDGFFRALGEACPLLHTLHYWGRSYIALKMQDIAESGFPGLRSLKIRNTAQQFYIPEDITHLGRFHTLECLELHFIGSKMAQGTLLRMLEPLSHLQYLSLESAMSSTTG